MAAAVDEKVKQIIVEQLQVDEAEVTPGASFQEDLGADSLDLVEVVMDLEDQFGLKIPDEDARGLTTGAEARDELVEHLTAGVDWVRAVETMTAAGVSTFIEIGRRETPESPASSAARRL